MDIKNISNEQVILFRNWYCKLIEYKGEPKDYPLMLIADEIAKSMKENDNIRKYTKSVNGTEYNFRFHNDGYIEKDEIVERMTSNDLTNAQVYAFMQWMLDVNKEALSFQDTLNKINSINSRYHKCIIYEIVFTSRKKYRFIMYRDGTWESAEHEIKTWMD